MKRPLAAVAAVFIALLGTFWLTGPASAAGTAMVSVVHGIPKTPVNVFVDGKSTLANFKPGTVAGPLQVPAGSHTVKIFKASDTKGTGTALLSATASLVAGTNVTIVAHLTAAGKPTLSVYSNDISMIPAGMSRLIVRHDAAAPAVDIRANGKVAFKSLTNPKQVMAQLPAGAIKADVVLAGTSTVAIGPANVNLAEGTDVIVYAIGSASGKTLSLAVQTISGLHSAPGGMPGGTGGQAAEQHGAAGRAMAAIVLGLLLSGGGLLTLRVARGRS